MNGNRHADPDLEPYELKYERDKLSNGNQQKSSGDGRKKSNEAPERLYPLMDHHPAEDRARESPDRHHHDDSDHPFCRFGRQCSRYRSFFNSVLDGFEGDEFGNVMKAIRKHGCKGRGMGSIFSFTGFNDIERKRIHDRWFRFYRVNPDSGRVIGALASNNFFRMGGRHNRLSMTGKVVLENMMNGHVKRRMHKFKPVVPPEQKGKDLPESAPPPKAPAPEPISVELGEFEKQRKKCLTDKVLFEDKDFPANDRSLYNKTPHSGPKIVWKRPGEIIKDPQLFVDEKSRFDVMQGQLGDCWLLAAIANLTLHDELFFRVVPPDQSFVDNYAGIFHFYFWNYGKWVEVVIDDRLPTIDGKLCYMHSRDHNEFWSALIEKAYAKLHGCYENLDGGTTAEALEDFTGGLTEFFDLTKADKTIVLATLVRGMQMGSLFGVSIDADANIREAQLNNGLVCGHAYSVTSLYSVKTPRGEIPLLRLRNPWGNSKEWTGAWGDSSSEWKSIDEQSKKELGVEFAQDGEFWMSFDDFFANFTQMEVCNLSAAIMDEISEMTGIHVSESQEFAWKETSNDGEWSSAKRTAGGCINNPTSYYTNPQFASYFTLPDNSVEDDGKCTVIVAVLQKYRRELRSVGKDNLPIGFAIYPTQSTSKNALDSNFFRRTAPVARSGAFINMREVTARFRMPPGDYVTVPCTYEPNNDGEFLLRIYANTNFMTNRLDA